jgi:parvulin-like peptidyl-prolyl isomerase
MREPAAPTAAVNTEVPPDTVVAVLNGRNFTAEDVRHLVAAMPPQAQAAYKADPKQVLRDHAYYLELVDYAQKNGIEKKSPYRDTLEFYRLFVLSNAALNEKLQTIQVSPEDQKKYYEEHQPEFREAHVRMIYFPFTDAKSDTEAKQKAEAVSKQAKGGEDFVKLAKQNSENPDAAGADFTVRMSSTQPPEQMKRLLLSATAGTVTDPLRHENGYYVFRVESADVLPYEKVRDEIYKNIQNAQFRDWQDKLRSQSSVKIQNEAFFSSSGSAK